MERKIDVVNEKLLSKGHYCYKIHTSLIESSASSSIDKPPYHLTPSIFARLPQFLPENLDPNPF